MHFLPRVGFPPGTRSRVRLFTIVLLSEALLLAGCGGTPGPAAARSKASSPTTTAIKGKIATVTWWNMYSGGVLPKLMNEIAADFNATHPGIHVTQLNVPSNGDTKLLAAIAAGNPPSVFTEWNPVLGEYAYKGLIQPLNTFLTGQYAGLEKWLYPVALEGGVYNSKLYGLPMSMNSFALYYNKTIMKAAGIKRPPTTLTQLNVDQAKEWKISGGRIQQLGFYPLTEPFPMFTSYFGDVKGFVNGKYNLAGSKKALALMTWLASYNKYSYSAVGALNSAYGAIAGGSEDPFDMGKEGFYVIGPWEGATDIPADNPSLKFGVEAFPSVRGSGVSSGSTWVNGNYNIIPKGAKNSAAAFKFIAWMTGYGSVSFTAKMLPKNGWLPASPHVAAAPAYQAWLRKEPWAKVFVKEFSNPASRQTTLSPAGAKYATALANAMGYVATKKMTPLQALQYVDRQANAALPKG